MKFIYKTVPHTTEEEFIAAEKLHAQGWNLIQVTPTKMLFEKLVETESKLPRRTKDFYLEDEIKKQYETA